MICTLASRFKYDIHVLFLAYAASQPIPHNTDKVYWSQLPKVHHIAKSSHSPLGLSIMTREVSAMALSELWHFYPLLLPPPLPPSLPLPIPFLLPPSPPPPPLPSSSLSPLPLPPPPPPSSLPSLLRSPDGTKVSLSSYSPGQVPV